MTDEVVDEEIAKRNGGLMKGEATSTQPGMVVVKGDEYVQHDAPARRSHICCGCCCDTRKAVFVVNIISITLGLLTLMSVSIYVGADLASMYDDDETKAAMSEISEASKSTLVFVISILVVGLICNSIAIFGAAKYNKIAIIIGAVWYVFDAIHNLVFANLGGAIMAVFFAYPHFVFWSEMRNGIMSSETYPIEKKCCDCC